MGAYPSGGDLTDRDIFGGDERPCRRELQRMAGGGYAYILLDDAIRIEARYLRRDHGALHAEVDVQCEWAGASRHGKSLSVPT